MPNHPPNPGRQASGSCYEDLWTDCRDSRRCCRIRYNKVGEQQVPGQGRQPHASRSRRVGRRGGASLRGASVVDLEAQPHRVLQDDQAQLLNNLHASQGHPAKSNPESPQSLQAQPFFGSQAPVQAQQRDNPPLQASADRLHPPIIQYNVPTNPIQVQLVGGQGEREPGQDRQELRQPRSDQQGSDQQGSDQQGSDQQGSRQDQPGQRELNQPGQVQQGSTEHQAQVTGSRKIPSVDEQNLKKRLNREQDSTKLSNIGKVRITC